MRAERSLLSAFAGWPKVVTPKKEKRIFQLRTYESPSQVAHTRKVQMFNEAEIGIFMRAGLTPGVLWRYVDRHADAEPDHTC